MPTKIVNLYENPPTPTAALGVARDIADGNTEYIKGTVQNWPRSRIEAGDWGGVQFLSPFLCESFIELRRGDYFKTHRLGKWMELGPAGQGVRGIFDRTEVPQGDSMIALWYHKTNVTQKMLATWDSYIKPKPFMKRQASTYWARRASLLISNRIFLPTIRCISVRLNEKVLGSSWIPCRPSTDTFDSELLEKALCVYMNSTVGILALLGERSNKKPTYPRMSLDDLRRIPMPDFNALAPAQVSALAAGYDALCEFTLLPLPLILKDETRLALDRIVTRALGIDAALAAALRRELAREPSITGKPYEV